MHPAIQLCLRHNGKVVLNRAIGHGWGNAPTDPPDAEKIPVTTDTPFCAYSAAKTMSTTVVHMLVERGHFSLDDRVCEYLPTYTSHGKDRTTIRHVMTHSAGVPIYTGPRPDLSRMNDSEYTREKLGELKPLHRPGLVHIYHGLTWGPLIREIVSAATGKKFGRSWPPRSSIRWASAGPTTVLRHKMFHSSRRATRPAVPRPRRWKRCSVWRPADRCRRSSRTPTVLRT